MRFTLSALAMAAAVAAGTIPTTSPTSHSTSSHNDFSCKSSHNPVVLLHGLGATSYQDLNQLEAWLRTKGLCTFSLTYGAYDGFPLVGGLKPIRESSPQIASFIRTVHQATGSRKVDLVGHSEGAFQALYTTKFGSVNHIVDALVAIAPPTHGTSLAGLYSLAELLGAERGVKDVLGTFGCKACADLVTGGAAVQRLNDGSPIVQPGTVVTVITSKLDELVTPTETSFVHEPGVNNIYVQDYCPTDLVGHIGEAYDMNVWNLVLNSLEKKLGRDISCVLAPPGR
ncbi:lipase (class 2) [Metarhizium robertsii]|uniref:Lipase n=2 Tax=Metarhizium robertsii TaxID=568076 RepID=E9F4P7_METRA|nr:lipase [Metarhizium robertsii ARSEF 23]EFY97229.1 lipase [Metarhizium robertsii ARSEF 23]EXV00697.1 lipase (class 2) [Metarhizium robertsii]